MIAVFNALLPVFLLVLIGAVFRKWEFPSLNFWVAADKVTYYIFLPALIVEKLSSINITWQDFYNSTWVLIIAVLAVVLLLVILQFFWKSRGSQFTSVFQGSIRPNTYVALALGAAFYGAQGLALTAVILAGIIPLVNVLSVTAFSLYIPKTENSKSVLRELVTNPLVLACAIGLLLSAIELELPVVLVDTLGILASAALPMGLISVGFGLKFKGNRTQLIPLVIASTAKLIILPAITYLLLVNMQVEGIHFTLCLLFASVPCAASSYILSTSLNGDHNLMASIITVETLLAFIVMPLIILILT